MEVLNISFVFKNFARFLLVASFMIFGYTYVQACNNSVLTVLNSVDNGNGTFTYTLQVDIELGVVDGAYYGFVLIFGDNNNGVTVNPGSFPAVLTPNGGQSSNLTGHT